MEIFNIGDKVRSKMDHYLIGTVSEICWNYWYDEDNQLVEDNRVVTVKDTSEKGYVKYKTFNACDIEKIDEEKETEEMTSYKIGDIVDHVTYGKCTITSLVSFKVGYIDVFSEDRGGIVPVSISDIEKIDEEKETEEMTSYKIGDIVDHAFYDESIVTDISNFETGDINIVPLTGPGRGKTKRVSISNLKKSDAFLISTENYNEMANTIENLNVAYQKLKKEQKVYHSVKHFEIGSRVFNKKYGYGNVREIGCHNFGITVMFDNCGSRVVSSDDLEIVTDREKELLKHTNCLRNKIIDLQKKLYLANDEAKCAETILALNTPAGKKLPEIKSVLYHKPATIIFWKDGTKTVVKAQNKEKYDKEKGFVMAYLKKILGNKGNYYEVIKRWTDTQ